MEFDKKDITVKCQLPSHLKGNQMNARETKLTIEAEDKWNQVFPLADARDMTRTIQPAICT
jgi:hypothetical protein